MVLTFCRSLEVSPIFIYLPRRFAGAGVWRGVYPGPGGDVAGVGASHSAHLHPQHRLRPLASDHRPRQVQGDM
jgi:hypothetical protein